ncbi:hypothetical protein [Allosediminivita pacifica]|uniref:CHRD domain-containing protein n=1 Tax=Allosediminivita pacifica TaxID=1267769 RepID=A0A2T6AQD2_9RHOB|nr:hypothetical protein [Allosediminivita pacifica]PTX46034.1 hypothetical protein C8N44_1189 [Allosediminivita pacifica]GGB18840.1 hypothetical protein GCM10011324_31250 [Allosediminivita pacifica]
MKINAIPRMAVLCLMAAAPAAAEMSRAVTEISPGHEVAAHWGSTVPGKGAAYILFDPEAGHIKELVLRIDGVPPDRLANAGPEGLFGPVHIHNYPQGGPDFFILQLPGEFTATETGFEFRLEDWSVEAPLGRKHDGIDATFVMSEIVAGNAYLGLHTDHALCPGNAAGADICAAPATALSGHLNLVPILRAEQLASYKQ